MLGHISKLYDNQRAFAAELAELHERIEELRQEIRNSEPTEDLIGNGNG